MSTTDTLTAFTTRLDALVLSPPLPVAWPGIPFEPPATGMWLEARHFPGEPVDLIWDNDTQQNSMGFFQVSVFWRPGTNTGQNSQLAASEIADLVIAHFPKGLNIDAMKVRKGPWQSTAVNLPGKSFIPVTIPYRGLEAVPGYSGALTTVASSSATEILTALVTHLDALALSPSLEIAWPGIPKDPPSTGMWLETRFIPAEPDDLVWDDDSQQSISGDFEVSVYWRPGSNTGQDSQVAASEVADLIAAHFPKGTQVNAVRVRKAPWQSPAIHLYGKSFIRVMVPYRGLVSVAGYAPVDTYYVVDGGVYVVDGGIQVIDI